MSLHTQNPNYSIATGDKTFDAVTLEADVAAVAVLYSDIDTDDVELYLEQSVDGTNWNEVPDSTIVLDNTKPSHLWNLTIKKGVFVRVGVRKKTATAGTIDKINTLT